MKTTKVGKFVTVCHHEKTEMYTVIIDNETKKVIKYHCRFTRMDKKGIQELVDKLINIYFEEGSLIYDPFTGIGTTQLSCIRNKCNYLGSELDKEHFDIAIDRINKLNNERRN